MTKVTRTIGPYPVPEGHGILVDQRCQCGDEGPSQHVPLIVLQHGPRGWTCWRCGQEHATHDDPRVQTDTWQHRLQFNGIVKENPYLNPDPNHGAAKRLLDEERYPLNEIGNSKRLVHLHGALMRYAPELDWMIYDGMRWRRDDKGTYAQRFAASTVKVYREAVLKAVADEQLRLKDPIVTHAERSNNAAAITNMVKVARSHPDILVQQKDFDSDPWLLNTPNLVVDLQTGATTEPDASHLFTRVTNTNYDPDAECPRWMQFLDEITLGNVELQHFLQLAMGYTLTGSVREECFFFLYGGGANGKSKFLGAIQDVLGDYAQTVPFDLFLARRFDDRAKTLAELPGSRMVLGIEAEEGRKWDTQTITTLTGGDRISARHLYSSPFQFEPTCKIWLAANHKPTINDPTDAFYRRFIPIPFQAQFRGEAQDKDLAAKLEAEANGILAWLVRGAMEWNDHGWTIPPIVEEARKDYRGDNDIFAQFVSERCEEGQGQEYRQRASDLLRAYNDFCEDNGERKATARSLSARLENYRGGILAKTHERDGKYWYGIRVLTHYLESRHKREAGGSLDTY